MQEINFDEKNSIFLEFDKFSQSNYNLYQNDNISKNSYNFFSKPQQNEGADFSKRIDKLKSAFCSNLQTNYNDFQQIDQVFFINMKQQLVDQNSLKQLKEKLFKQENKFISNFYHNFLQNCFFQEYTQDFSVKFFENLISALKFQMEDFISKLIKIASNQSLSKLSQSSVNQKGKKLVWNQEEEGFLYRIIEQNHPLAIPKEQTDKFCFLYERTPSSVLNKIQKLRKIHNERLDMEVMMQNSFLLERKKNKLKFQNQVYSIIQQRQPISYEQLLESLHIQNDSPDKQSILDEVLYNLLTSQRLKFRQGLYIEIKDKFHFSSLTDLEKLIVNYMKQVQQFSISFEQFYYQISQQQKYLFQTELELVEQLKKTIQNSPIFHLSEKKEFLL